MRAFAGLDLNGLADHVAQLDWPDRGVKLRETLVRPQIVDFRDGATFLVGDDAARHPGGRGWRRPAWTENVARRPVADLLAVLSEEKGDDAVPALAAHLRHLGRFSESSGFVVADDLSVEAQTLLLEAVRRAARYTPRHGWRAWSAKPLWRSVAALFAWAAEEPPEDVRTLKGGQALCLCLLPDRLTAATFKLDVEETSVGALLTPVRFEPGRTLGAEVFPPEMLERDLLKEVERSDLRRQLEAIGAGAFYAQGAPVEALLQDRDGRWMIPPKVSVRDDLWRRSIATFRTLVTSAIEGSFDLILIETPDEKRGVNGRSWASLALEILRAARSDERIEPAPPQAAARGAAEYEARLAHELPTFFDHLPQIEILAEESGEMRFIPLIPKGTRVEGNQPFKDELPGKFFVDPEAEKLPFYLFKDGEDGARHSETRLPYPPERVVPLTLRVEQKPVSGHASIEVVPDVPGALGPSRIMLDWRKMTPTRKTREETIAGFENARPGWPHAAPTRTHWAVWEAIALPGVMESFLQTQVSRSSKTYADAVYDLMTRLQRQVSPATVGLDADVPERLRPFNSDGLGPDRRLSGGRENWADLTARVKQKIAHDISALTGSQSRKNTLVRRLCLCGAWMFAGAPDEALDYFRCVMRGEFDDPWVNDGIGRSVSQPEDIKLAFGHLHARLEGLQDESEGDRARAAMNELKAAASILRYREDAARLLTPLQARTIAAAAIRRMSDALDANNLSLNFLWSASAFLLVLRYRAENSSFLSPARARKTGSKLYIEAETTLERANEAIRQGRRCHRQAPEVVESALAFLRKSGGNPDIIKAIGDSLDSTAKE